MSAVLLAPHNDDETLFACWQILRHKPLVAVCTRSQNQEDLGLGVYASDREAETSSACAILGVDFEQWEYDDTLPLPLLKEHLWLAIHDAADRFDTAIAPAVEEAGNPHHSLIGQLALDAFGPKRTIQYTTYTGFPGYKTRTTKPVPYEQEWLLLKLRALACYESQIRIKSGAFRFFANDLEEYLVP